VLGENHGNITVQCSALNGMKECMHSSVHPHNEAVVFRQGWSLGHCLG